ncbi:metallophosphoesterase [Salinibacillus aidingensis]|uniref:Metallophosphoesterase n=1 Tax=Salinibacillus aidingensis TaxID=237684 RepID=A0ABN1B8L4_9BACI
MDKIKNITIPNNSRIIVISDIHGEIELFKELLKKVHFNKEDYLIINGDLCEKGSNSEAVVKYIMELSSKSLKVHVTEGNCDTLAEDLLDGNPDLIEYLYHRPHSILNEWLDQLGMSLNERLNIQEVKELLTKHFSEEMKWLTNLPTAIETDRYIFVHAGLEDKKDWKNTKRDNAITMSSFLEKTHSTDKYVIVGHWPVVNYSSDTPSHNPIIDEKKKIIAIDGGNVIKETGQLNALIIERTVDAESFSYVYADPFPTCKVVKDFCKDPRMKGSIEYPFYEIIPLEENNDFTLCEQTETNRQVYVKNEYISRNKKGRSTVKTDVSCTQINVNAGDIVSVIDDTCSAYVLIKKDGKVGWVAKECIR